MGRINKKPEDKIKDKCLAFLLNWQELGIVLHSIDISDHGRRFNPYSGIWVMNTQQGRPDLITWFKVNGHCFTYFIECKSDIGRQSDQQKEFESKFIGMQGVIYEVVSKPQQINATIEKFTGYGEEKLKQLPEVI